MFCFLCKYYSAVLKGIPEFPNKLHLLLQLTHYPLHHKNRSNCHLQDYSKHTKNSKHFGTFSSEDEESDEELFEHEIGVGKSLTLSLKMLLFQNDDEEIQIVDVSEAEEPNVQDVVSVTFLLLMQSLFQSRFQSSLIFSS